jgi:hypothetical protein
MLAQSRVLHCDNPTDVNELFCACVADCWMRGAGYVTQTQATQRQKDASKLQEAKTREIKFFWRAVLGVCYFHAMVAREQLGAFSLAFPGVSRVSLPQLLQVWGCGHAHLAHE